MTIFTIPGWYPTDAHPQQCIFIHEQMKELVKLGHRVVVLSPQQHLFYQKCTVSKGVTHKVVDGVVVLYMPAPAIHPTLIKWQYRKSYQKSLDTLFKRALSEFGMPDVLYAHFSFVAGYCSVKLSKKYNVPLVTLEHYSGYMEGGVDYGMKEILSYTVENSAKFVCVSDGLRNVVQKLTNTKKKIYVVSNMINECFQYTPLPKREDFIFFALGSLINRKGFDLLIDAFAEEFASENNVKLRIAGSGPDKPMLLQKATESSCASEIKFIGQLTRERTLEEYANCNSFVLPSRAETFGLVYREAMAVGRPIISTRHGGFTDNDWHEEFGFLIDIDDKAALKSAMRKIYEEYNGYDLQAISQLCLNSCKPDIVIKQIESLLK